jgi:hypothetical protein
MKHEGAAKRERAIAYALSHQVHVVSTYLSSVVTLGYTTSTVYSFHNMSIDRWCIPFSLGVQDRRGDQALLLTALEAMILMGAIRTSVT